MLIFCYKYGQLGHVVEDYKMALEEGRSGGVFATKKLICFPNDRGGWGNSEWDEDDSWSASAWTMGDDFADLAALPF